MRRTRATVRARARLLIVDLWTDPRRPIAAGANNGHFAEWNLGDKSLAPYNCEAFVLAFLVQRF
jgi:hypothetical protein